MISIRNLLEKRAEYPLSKEGDSWLQEDLNNETQEDVWLITVSSTLHNSGRRKVFEQILAKYSLTGVYNLGAPFYNTGAQMELIHLSSMASDNMDVSIYKGQIFIRGVKRVKQSDGLFALPEKFSMKYEKYLEGLESWINGGAMPEDDNAGEYEYNTIVSTDISDNYLFPEYYSKKAMDVRRLLQQETLVKLGDITEIIMPRPVTDMVGKVVGMTDLKYPFDIDSIAENTATSVVLQKNDIILPSVGSVKPFLIADELDEKIYANRNMFVLRCKDIQPEYLYLYLNSEVCQTILDSQKLGCFISKITMKAAKDIPVIMPTKDEQEYSLQAQILTHIERRSYQFKSDVESRVLAYWKALHKNDDKKPEKVEDILEMELLETLKVHSTNQLQEMLHDDWKELNDCFRVGAYKATLILAGSILEAVLIDWLSEIKGHDYFAEDYVITDRNGRQKRADLIDYINEIKYIERPHWIHEATKAHEIRKKRNLVHAKLGINSDEINEETCRMVIDYLRDVIKTRDVEEQ